MAITGYADVDEILNRLLGRMQEILGEKLRGLYLYGSLVMGDFNRAVSDIDLLAVLAADMNEGEFERLKGMHDDLVAEYPAWDNRIEVAYLSEAGLKTFRSQASPIAVISPGEPFHIEEAGWDWLVNWWVVREWGVALFGPEPARFIGPIAKEEFLAAVRAHAQWWDEWVHKAQSQPAQAYAILTLCRALYASRQGEQASKKQAALWVQDRFPEWAWLVEQALAWREGRGDETDDPEATLPVTVRFVRFAIDAVLAEG